MKKKGNTFLSGNKKGRASLEILATMLLLILLGAGLFSLTISTAGAYRRLHGSREKSSELRVASSFITMKIRQNDLAGSLDVLPHPITGRNALVVYEQIEGTSYATWIFHYDGYLLEALVLSNEEPAIDLSQPVAKIDEFDITFNEEERGIFFKVGAQGCPSGQSFIKIRSGMRE